MDFVENKGQDIPQFDNDWVTSKILESEIFTYLNKQAILHDDGHLCRFDQQIKNPTHKTGFQISFDSKNSSKKSNERLVSWKTLSRHS